MKGLEANILPKANITVCVKGKHFPRASPWFTTTVSQVSLIYRHDLTDSSLAYTQCGDPPAASGEPWRAVGIIQSSQSGRLPRDWEEMGPNGIRLWPGRSCLQPCHSILLCDCDHGRQTPQIAGNKNERGFEWNSGALRKRTHVAGNQRADCDAVRHAAASSSQEGDVETDRDVNRGFYPVKT